MLFCARMHVWVKRAGSSRARLGLTAHGLEHVGSIDNVAAAAALGSALRPHDELLSINWAGFEISGADELYHTTWDNVDGTAAMRVPVPCTLHRLNDEAIDMAKRFELHRFSERTWLAEVELEHGFDWAPAAARGGGACAEGGHALLSEQAYGAHVHTLEPGRFAEPPEVEWV